MGHAGPMHLPGPIRAAVGLVASAAEEARHLPDKAIELPMLAVSTALQASLRAQQRYARYAALGDQVLNRRAPTEEPPAWATFDEPVSVDEIRRSAMNGSANGFPDAGSLLDDLFGVSDPGASSEAEPGPKPGKKPSAKKPAADKQAADKPAADKPAAKKKSADKSASKKAGAKTVNKPRHTAASAFDNAEDPADIADGTTDEA
jgi:hypothetical protein